MQVLETVCTPGTDCYVAKTRQVEPRASQWTCDDYRFELGRRNMLLIIC